MGSNDKVWLDLDLGRRSNWGRGCVIERSNPKAGVGQILELYLEYFSSYVPFSKLKRKTLNMGVKDKVRTDLDLHKGSILGMAVYAIERSYPKVGVGQIWKQYLKQLKNYTYIWKLKHCANADADADRRRRQRLGDNISSPGT